VFDAATRNRQTMRITSDVKIPEKSPKTSENY
jgi:hypothetical protein